MIRDNKLRSFVFCALLASCSCGSQPTETDSWTFAPGEVQNSSNAQNTRAKGLDGELASAEEPRLQGWPDEESRLRLQTSEAGVLIFESNGSILGERAEAVDVCQVDPEHLVVRVGPVGEWYANDTLYLLIDAKSHGILAAGVYVYSDLGGMGGWGTIRGRVWYDSIMAGPGSGRLRCSYELFAEDDSEEVWFEGHFELDASAESPSLRRDLESFGVNFSE